MAGVTAGMLGFDLETTGVDPETARIVSYALVHRGGPLRRDLIRTGLASGVEIPPDATAIHGITTAFANTFGRSEELVVDFLCNELAAASRRGTPLVGMNLAYDLTLLDRRARVHRLWTVCERLGSWRWVDHKCPSPVFDVYVLDKMADRYRKGSRKLSALVAHHLGREHENAHDAVADVVACLDIAEILLKSYKTGMVPLHDIGIHHKQAAARRHQQASLLEYFRRLDPLTGARCDPCWPVCHHDQGITPAPEPPLSVDLRIHQYTWDEV